MVRKLLDDGIKERVALLRRKEAIINIVREDSLYDDVPNIPVISSDEDDDDTDEHGMSALERKILKQAMVESRYTGFVEDETRRCRAEDTMAHLQKGQLLDQNVEFHKVLE
ncbi:hypothetical protein Salat_1874800 [Sesamum alatum]|uniref:Uncharacterized protein n=1 Tax=Sesamum alatum TaxID=300844 RepID=A0AAE1Y427_9LAMI|nr:hypothetical protein Salat_1874800 [Sesamum alatum]